MITSTDEVTISRIVFIGRAYPPIVIMDSMRLSASFGPHAQAVLDQVAHRDLAYAFKIRRPRLEPHDMRLLELKFGRVFAGDDSFVEVDIVRQAVQ
jgi:hypothetical protein